MSILVPNGSVTYDGQEANKVFFAPLFKDPTLNDIFRVIPDIKSKRKIYMSPRLEKIVKGYEGCGWHPSNPTAPISQKYLEVEPLEVQL